LIGFFLTIGAKATGSGKGSATIGAKAYAKG
jgi:hypothetical protein